MTSFVFSLLIVCLTYPIPSYSVFSLQETLTIVCDQFPLVSTFNDSTLQCARLRLNGNVPITSSGLNTPTQLILFIIIDQSSSQLSPINIIINFNQSPDLPSSINEIRLILLVTHAYFIINNQTSTVYTPYNIPIFLWQSSMQNTYELIDLVQIGNQTYTTDTSLCRWNTNLWNRLFNGNISMNISYVYFLKTTNPQLTYTLIDASNQSLSPSPPSPYLNIVYCVSYKLGVTEIVLIVCFGVGFVIVVIILGVLHYLKGGEDNRTRHLQLHHHHHHHHRDAQDKSTRKHSKRIRYRPGASKAPIEEDDSIFN